MRFFRQLRRRGSRRPVRWVTWYRSAACRPVPPGQVRQRRFGWTPLGRRGLDPVEVYAFLDRVAGELGAAHEALDRSREKADRVRSALRRWQSEQVRAGGGRWLSDPVQADNQGRWLSERSEGSNQGRWWG